MSDFHTIAAAYISTWNEGSSDQRRALLQTHWSEEARYVDPLMAGSGRDEIDALIAGAHARFPGFVFVLVGSVDGYADKVRFSWGWGLSATRRSS